MGTWAGGKDGCGQLASEEGKDKENFGFFFSFLLLSAYFYAADVSQNWLHYTSSVYSQTRSYRGHTVYIG